MSTTLPHQLAEPESPLPASPRRHDRNVSRTGQDSRAMALLHHDDARVASSPQSRRTRPLAPGSVPSGAETGLPPTPPTISQGGSSTQSLEQAPHVDSVVNALMSKTSSLSTPVNNARSPPTPDPSPPRNPSSATKSLSAERPTPFTYPSSRAESFTTAREDPFSSEASDDGASTPLGSRPITNRDVPLGLAFEREDNDVAPKSRQALQPKFPKIVTSDAALKAKEHRASPVLEVVPDWERNAEQMRNVTVRKKRNSQPSPRKAAEIRSVNVDEPSSPAPSTRARPTSSLRQRIEASNNSPHTPSIENFAHSIGWPLHDEKMLEEKQKDNSSNRFSASSVSSTVVEAVVIATPLQRRQTLRHSGKNMAYRRDASSPTEMCSDAMSARDSIQSMNLPLHKLVHKRRVSVTESSKRSSGGSDNFEYDATSYSSLSLRQRTIDSSAHTLRHQESLRMILQPAADEMVRHNSISRSGNPAIVYHNRFSSAPEPRRKSPESPAQVLQTSDPRKPPHSARKYMHSSPLKRTSSPTPASRSIRATPASPSSTKLRIQQRGTVTSERVIGVEKSPPDNSIESHGHIALQDIFMHGKTPVQDVEEKQPPPALMERVRQLVAQREAGEDAAQVAEASQTPTVPEPIAQPSSSPLPECSPYARRGSQPLGSHSRDQRRGSLGHEPASLSRDALLRPSLDRMSTEESMRRSYEWRRASDDHGRCSFDRSTLRIDEHAMARYLFAQETPFSQLSDTPIEVSEATAISIFPHNNHSLLVVQQMSRGNSMFPESGQAENDMYHTAQIHRDWQPSPTPPFVDASEVHGNGEDRVFPPRMMVEPSTPPMQVALVQTGIVDSPLKNPRPPPEPPRFNFIPPTPAEELERQLVPSPPKRSGSHPQRRLSLAQRARRYSDQLLPTLLSRASSNRARRSTDAHAHAHAHTHRNPRVPTVNDEEGTLHPFWRPRGFWDDFTESDSGSDDGLPRGGDTSDVEDAARGVPRRSHTLTKRLASGMRGSGGFLIGNTLGVERHGTNTRRHHVTLPAHFPKSLQTSARLSSPSGPRQPLTRGSGRPLRNKVLRRGSRSKLRARMPHECPTSGASWRQGRSVPGLRKYQVQYIGLSGVKKKLRERTAEKRRDKVRKSIGTRYYVEPGMTGSPATVV